MVPPLLFTPLRPAQMDVIVDNSTVNTGRKHPPMPRAAASSIQPKYTHCSQKIYDIQEGRLLTLTGDGSARWRETNTPVTKSASFQVSEVTSLRGAGAALVKGVTVSANGEARKNARLREVIVAEGSFVVWW